MPADHSCVHARCSVPLPAGRAGFPRAKGDIIRSGRISLRGCEAALVPGADGWRNVRVMEGGIVAWPYPGEK